MAAVSLPGYWILHDGIGILCYVDTHCPQWPLIALGSFRRESLESRFAHQLDGAFEILPVEYGNGVFYLALRGFDLGLEKRSQDSAAEYLAKLDLGDRGFLLQRIPPNARTSSHAHSQKTEEFCPILGCPTVTLGSPRFEDGERDIRLRRSLFVPENVWHRLETNDHPVLTIIEVVGPNALSMNDYTRE